MDDSGPPFQGSLANVISRDCKGDRLLKWQFFSGKNWTGETQ